MNQESEPVHIGEIDDIDLNSVENFEHEEIDYAIFHLESGFFATQGHCNCDEQAFISEGNVEGEEVECPSCSNVFSIVSGDSINDEGVVPLKIYDVTEEDGNIYLNL
jgi:Ferredoxin subunits of nitrite reductase and ring-hydroxylating dioxygenases